MRNALYLLLFVGCAAAAPPVPGRVVATADVFGGVDLLEAEGWAAHGKTRPDGPDLDGDGVPNDVRWESLPIRVVVSPSLAPVWAAAFVQGAGQLADVLGQDVFVVERRASERERIAIEVGGGDADAGTVYLTSAGEDPRHGTTVVRRLPDGRARSATVTLPAECGGCESRAGRIMLHELLHVLGYAHSGGRMSIMRPVVSEQEQFLPRAAALLLRRTYRGSSLAAY